MGKVLVVETGLAEEVAYRGQAYTRHARTRFVERAKPVEPEVPKLGDPWCPVTVRARLQRVNWVLTKDPKVGPADVRSCMPEPVREVFKDLPGEPMRIPVPRADQTATNLTLQSVIGFKDRDDRLVIWAIAGSISDRDLAPMLGVAPNTAASRKLAMLARLAADWNARGWQPDVVDVARAESLLHRKVK